MHVEVWQGLRREWEPASMQLGAHLEQLFHGLLLLLHVAVHFCGLLQRRRPAKAAAALGADLDAAAPLLGRHPVG